MTVFENKQAFFDGVRDGLPIGMAYFAVVFSLGIAAKTRGSSRFKALPPPPRLPLSPVLRFLSQSFFLFDTQNTAAAKVAFLLPVCE